MEPNILLARIDNRLVHGQVGVAWTTSLGANLIVVVDDEVVDDEIQKSLMTMTAESSGVGIRFFTVEKTINVIFKASKSQKIFIVAKTPKVIRKLIDGGVPIKEVNVGNMHFDKGKEQLSKKVYVSLEELEDLRYISKVVENTYIQDLPGDIKTKIK